MESVRYGLARRGGASHADSPPPHDRRRGVRHESAIDGALARPLRRPGSVAFQAAMTPFVGAFSFPSLQPIDRPHWRRAFHRQRQVAAFLRGQSFRRQWGGLLHHKSGADQRDGALPAFACELQGIAVLADFDRAGLREDPRLGQKVGVGVLPGEFHPASAVLGGEDGAHLGGFQYPFGGTVAIQVGGPDDGGGARNQHHAHRHAERGAAGNLESPVAHAGAAFGGEHAELHAALVGGADADVGFRRQEFQAPAGRRQLVGLDLRRIIANGDFEIAAGLGVDGGDGWFGSHFGHRAEVELHAGEQADGGGTEELNARAAERNAIGFQGEAGGNARGGGGGGGGFGSRGGHH